MWHRMTRVTGPECAVMFNIIDIHTTHTLIDSIIDPLIPLGRTNASGIE